MNLLIFILIPIFSFQTTEWRLDRDKNSIQVYTREVEGNPIREFKAQSKTKTSFDKLINLFLDIEGYVDWIPDIKESEQLEKLNDTTYHYRMVVNAPFPVNDRDLISEMVINQVDENTLRIELSAIPDKIPEEKGLIRIPFSDGYWEFKSEGDSITINNQFLSDPGGTIPNWVINMFLTNNPYNTILNLKESVE